MVATSHKGLLSTSHVTDATEELNFKFYWIFINNFLYVSLCIYVWHMGLVVPRHVGS